MAKKKWDENKCDNCARLLKDHSFADVGRCSTALHTARPDLTSLPVAVWQYVADLEDERDSLDERAAPPIVDRCRRCQDALFADHKEGTK